MTIFAGQVGGGASPSTDDGAQNGSGVVNLTRSSDNIDNVGTNSAVYYAARILNVTIPGTATASASSISVYPTTANVTMDASIYANKVANPSTLSTSASYISGLAATSAAVTWNATLTQSAFNASPDVSPVINELLGQGSWAPGNAILPIFHALASVACNVTDYDGTPANAVEVSITYSSGGGSPSNAAFFLRFLGP